MADENNAAPSPARLRAEARKQKILAKGNDRLAKITGAMQNRSESSVDHLKTETLDSDEPPEVDISKLDSMANQRTDSSRQPTVVSGSSSANLSSSSNGRKLGNQKKVTKQSQSVPFPEQSPMNSSVPPNAADPMLQMMKAMGMDLPNSSGSGPDGMFGSDGAPNPMMQQAFAGLSGMQPTAVEKTWVDRIFPFLNILTVVGLILSATLWWNPMSQYWRQIQPFRSLNQDDSQVDLRAEWEALHPSGSTPAVRQALGPAPVFWMFVTIELVLQATRWMFNRSARPPGLLTTLIHSLPRPYCTLASTALKYFAIISSLINDLGIMVFGVGCAVIWLEWKHSPDHGLFELLQPNSNHHHHPRPSAVFPIGAPPYKAVSYIPYK